MNSVPIFLILCKSILEQTVRPKGWTGAICRNSLLFNTLHFSKQEEHGTYKEFEKLLNFRNLICFFWYFWLKYNDSFQNNFLPTFLKTIHRFQKGCTFFSETFNV